MIRMIKRFKRDFTPKFHSERINEIKKIKEPSKIFVGSSGDMFGDWVPKNWILSVLDVVKKFPQHTFQFLTKNPKRYREFKFPKNCWLGTTVDGTERTSSNIVSLMAGRKTGVKDGQVYNNIMFVSFEPLLHDFDGGFYGVDWIIIGADSTLGAKRPPIEWADNLIKEARKTGAAVFVKDNYSYPQKIKEFPKIKT